MKTRLKSIGLAALAVLFVWLLVANLVFAFRHPWATQTERLIYLPRAMVFEKVSYSEARLRD